VRAGRGGNRKRGWDISLEIKDVGSGATVRQKREELLAAARRREIDLVVVWRLDRWGRSLVDLVNTLQELSSIKVGFVSLSEALDLTTPSGRALAGMLAVFAEFERDILRDRVKAGIAQARKEGRPHGRPLSAGLHLQKIRELFRKGISKWEIANLSFAIGMNERAKLLVFNEPIEKVGTTAGELLEKILGLEFLSVAVVAAATRA
jgi:putative DNA-invertase from lambdoid prophage Rac